jgi:uncharacterized protein (TIGR02646 family)
MIKVVKSSVPIPTKLTTANCHRKLHLIWNSGNHDATRKARVKSADYYYANETVTSALRTLYHNKCAYCETFDDEFEIEHYRPKAEVAEDTTHPGYYWLCLEWTNLLPACHDCNKARSKSTKFPINGTRMMGPIMNGTPPVIDRTQNQFQSVHLLAERALLLHPEEPNFDPFHYFRFDNTGRILAKDQLRRSRFDHQRANETIKILRLNRDKLYLMGKKIELLKIIRKLKTLLIKLLRPLNPISLGDFRDLYFYELLEIKNNTQPNQPYSFFWDYVYQHILTFIFSHVRQNAYTKKLFEDLTEEFKTNNP